MTYDSARVMRAAKPSILSATVFPPAFGPEKLIELMDGGPPPPIQFPVAAMCLFPGAFAALAWVYAAACAVTTVVRWVAGWRMFGDG